MEQTHNSVSHCPSVPGLFCARCDGQGGVWRGAKVECFVIL